MKQIVLKPPLTTINASQVKPENIIAGFDERGNLLIVNYSDETKELNLLNLTTNISFGIDSVKQVLAAYPKTVLYLFDTPHQRLNWIANQINV